MKRDVGLDLLKCLGCFAVVILHVSDRSSDLLNLFLYWNQGVCNLVLGFISSFSIYEIIIKEFSMSSNYVSNNIEIDSIIYTSSKLGVINTELLKDLQSMIFSRRKSGFNVPSFIHKLNRITAHSKYSRDN